MEENDGRSRAETPTSRGKLTAKETLEASAVALVHLEALKKEHRSSYRTSMLMTLDPDNDMGHRELRAWLVCSASSSNFGVRKIPKKLPRSQKNVIRAKMFIWNNLWLSSVILSEMEEHSDDRSYCCALAFCWTSALRKLGRFAESAVFAAILDGKMRAAVGPGILNRVWPGSIENVEPMLARDKLEAQCLPGFMSRKLNGVRLLTVKRGSEIKFLSRKGKELSGLRRLKSQIGLVYGDFVLDGELCSSSLCKATSISRGGISGADIDSGDYTYYVFDLLEIEEWESSCGVHPANVRNDGLLKICRGIHSMLNNGETPLIRPLKQYVIMASSQINPVYDRLKAEPFREPWEGIILKGMGPYVFGERVMYKKKDTIDVDAEVLEVLPGDGRFLDTLGSISVKYCDTGKTGGVGTGFSDEVRNAIWSDPYSYIGRIAKIKIQSWLPTGLPQHPVWLGLREESVLDI